MRHGHTRVLIDASGIIGAPTQDERYMLGLFVAAEFGLVKIRTTQVDRLVQEGRATARLVKDGFQSVASQSRTRELPEATRTDTGIKR